MSDARQDRPPVDRLPTTRAPISLQLVALLLASLMVMEAISFGIILLMPPPRPAVYRVGDVATAIHGGSLKTRFGRPLVRTVAHVLPAELAAPHREHERTLAALARALGAPEARVRLEEQNPSPIWRLRRAMTGAAPPRGRDRSGPMGASPFETDREGEADGQALPRRRVPGGPE